MGTPRLLPGETLELRLRPRVMSFLPQYLIATIPAIWAIVLWGMVRSEWWPENAGTGEWWEVWTFLYGGTVPSYVYTFLVLGAIGAGISVVAIRWRIFFAYIAVAAVAVGLTAGLAHEHADWALPLALWASAVPGILLMEANRQSHVFLLTNLRILFRGGFLVRKERQLRYESITDLDGSQGPLGRIFGYGTLIPVTQSGFGLGADTSQANIGVAAGGKGEAKGVGVGGLVGVSAGGGKEVSVGRARTFHQLTGVGPYKDVKFLLETLIQSAAQTPYLRQQVDLQQQMVKALAALGGAPHAPSGLTPPGQAAHVPPAPTRRARDDDEYTSYP